jgi:hypothetical protein
MMPSRHEPRFTCLALCGLSLLACGSTENTWGTGPSLDGGNVDADAATVPDATTDSEAETSIPEAASDTAGDAVAEAQDVSQPDAAIDAGPYPCDEVDAFGPVFGDVIDTWFAQDAIGGWPQFPVVFVGSSSIRRWEGLVLAYSDYSPLQRGFGGAQLGEVAHFADELVVRHAPRAVVLFAGTNDVNAGVAPTVVVDRFRCFRYRIGHGLGWHVPVVFVGITPTPARWAEWPQASAVNAAIAQLAVSDPAISYADVPAAFLATGSPPKASLFAPDQLHLSAEGYALWDQVLRPVVESATPTTQPAGTPAVDLPSGARVLVDLGPSNPDDGEPTPSPDHQGQHWNNWHEVEGDRDVLPGEQLVDLRTTDGTPTGIDLVIGGGFRGNGRSHGGLLWPSSALLGTLAVGSATGDFFFADDDDAPGAIFLRDLDPSRTYRVRLFAARESDEVRVTRYTVRGATTTSATLQTSGPGAGHDGGHGNDDDAVVMTELRPDAWGHLFVDVSVETGTYAYLSALELQVE